MILLDVGMLLPAVVDFVNDRLSRDNIKVPLGSEAIPAAAVTPDSVGLKPIVSDIAEDVLSKEVANIRLDDSSGIVSAEASENSKDDMKKLEPESYVILGFRGINHMPGRFSDDCRRLLREKEIQELKKEVAYFRESVQKCIFDFYRDPEKSSQYKNLLSLANQLKKDLEGLQNTPHVLSIGLSDGANRVRLFGNMLDTLQHIYTNGIIMFQYA